MITFGSNSNGKQDRLTLNTPAHLPLAHAFGEGHGQGLPFGFDWIFAEPEPVPELRDVVAGAEYQLQQQHFDHMNETANYSERSGRTYRYWI
jgi:hypothetical protein